MQDREKYAKEMKKTLIKFIKIILPVYLFIFIGLTQYFAYKVHFNKILGGISFSFFPKYLKKIYFPFEYLFWRKEYIQDVPKLISKLDNFLLYISLFFLLLLFIIVKKKEKVTVHGSARWSTKEEIEKMKLYEDSGLVLGCDPRGRIIRDNGDKHVLMSAPTRGGKGINSVTPTALDWINSVVFNDIKGELWDLTSGYRKNVLGQKVFMFCPVDTTGVSCSYNPLDYVAIGTLEEYGDVSIISETLLDTEGKGESDHWIGSAINLLNGVILHVKYANPKASLVDVIKFLTPTDISLVDQIADILGVPREDEEGESGIAVRNNCAESFEEGGNEDGTDAYSKLGECCFDHLKHFENKNLFKELHGAIPTRTDKYCRLNPTVAREFMSFFKTPDKERGSILSTATRKLKIFMDPLLTPLISHSDFTIKQLMEEKCSLYLVTPPRALNRTKPIMRLVITQIVYILADKVTSKKKKEKDKFSFTSMIKESYQKIYDYVYPIEKKKKNSILLLIDEFPQLGKLEVVEQAMSYIAGYGLKCFLITQSLKQLKKIYGKDNYIQDNCSIQIFLTPNDEETPKMISDMFDNYTTKVTSESRKGFELMPTRSTSYVARKLMTPGEVRSLPYDEILLMLTGEHPIKGKKLKYYEVKRYIERILEVPKVSDKNPPKIVLPNGYVFLNDVILEELEDVVSKLIEKKKEFDIKGKIYDVISYNETIFKHMNSKFDKIDTEEMQKIRKEAKRIFEYVPISKRMEVF